MNYKSENIPLLFLNFKISFLSFNSYVRTDKFNKMKKYETQENPDVYWKNQQKTKELWLK